MVYDIVPILTALVVIIIVVIVISIVVHKQSQNNPYSSEFYYKAEEEDINDDMYIPAECVVPREEHNVDEDRKVNEPNGEYTIRIEGLGNFLVEYFMVIALFFVYKKDAIINKQYYGPHVDCVEKLPSYIPYDAECHKRLLEIPNIRQRLDCSYQRISDWSYNRGLLKAMIPFIQRTLNSVIQPIKPVADVVIHFRCADTPRNRHEDYMFQRFKWYIKAIKEASKLLQKPREDLSVVILSCKSWGDKNKNSDQAKLCSAVVDRLAKKLGVKYVKIRCSSVNEDFLTMISAPCLISPGSSLSYMAAMASDKFMITPNYLNIPDTYYRDNWIMLPPRTLEHCEVDNYDNITTILRQLSQ